MRPITSILLLSLIVLTSATCNKNANNGTGICYKGKLAVKGICMNYTITVSSAIDTSKVEANWQDPNTGTNYTNAFALASVCDFPNNIEQGQEFYFRIRETSTGNCAVCQAYYPTPAKKLAIEVLSSPCP